MPRTIQHLLRSALLGFGLLLIGCGPPGGYIKYPETGATLEGTVKYGSEPVQVAMIIVQSEKGSATGFIGEDGRYKVENAPLGEVGVAVNTHAGKGQAMGQMMARSRQKGNAPPPPKLIDVPAKYGDPMKSGIKTTVNKGQNTFDIVIPK